MLSRKNKIITVLFVFIGLLFINAYGQRPMRKGHLNLDQIKSELQLTAEQEASITAIQEKYKEKFEALKAGESTERGEKRIAFRELMKAQRAEIAEVLSEEQKVILKAKRQEKRRGMKEKRSKVDREGLHQEIKAYKEQNIMPILLEQRAKLESKITEEDKVQIATLRPTFEEMKEKREGKRFKRERGNPEQRTERKAVIEQRKKELEPLKALVEKYNDEITTLFAEIETEQNQWKEDIKAIGAKYRPEGIEGNGSRGRKMHKRHHKIKGEKGFFIPKRHFLLLDPNAESANSTSGKYNAITEVKVFPNPSYSSNTLNYTVKKAGKIRIELRDQEGNTQKVLLDAYREIGEYSLQVDVSQLESGIYYYTINDASGVTSQKIAVSKK